MTRATVTRKPSLMRLLLITWNKRDFLRRQTHAVDTPDEAASRLIEDKASGTQLIQELIADGCHGVTRYQPTGDKTMRRRRRTPFAASRRSLAGCSTTSTAWDWPDGAEPSTSTTSSRSPTTARTTFRATASGPQGR